MTGFPGFANPESPPDPTEEPAPPEKHPASDPNDKRETITKAPRGPCRFAGTRSERPLQCLCDASDVWWFNPQSGLCEAKLCRSVPPVNEGPCAGRSDALLPESETVRTYQFTDKERDPEAPYPISGIFLEEAHGKLEPHDDTPGEFGYTVPGELTEKTESLIIRINGVQDFELLRPFAGGTSDPTVLWGKGKLGPGWVRSIKTLLKAQGYDPSRVREIEIVGLKAKGLD